jgi:SpoVK/Ycf46/Vps4 family AAA+-type ATPase
MKNLILYAKYIAIKNDSDEIIKDYIVEAYISSKIDDETIKKRLKELLHIDGGDASHYIKQSFVDIALKHPTIPFDDETKLIIHSLSQEGFSLSETNVKTYSDNKDIVIDVADENKKYKKNAKTLILLGKIKDKLSPIIFDQDIAIESVKDTISRAIFEEREDSVKALLFFIGPPATGKTYLSEETGKLLEMFGYTTKVFNMTLYSEDTSNLTGLAEPRVGAGKGDLTKFIEKNPKSLIIFDEIEKCHPIQQRNLFRLLDRGYIEDKFDNSITQANEVILIFTSNLGKDIYSRTDYTTMIRSQKETESLLLDAIAKEKSEYNSNMQALTPALVSRLSAAKVVLFNKIGINAYFKIASLEIKRYFSILKQKFGVKFQISDEAILSSLLTYMPFFDPRRIKGKIGDSIFDIIRDYIQTNDINLSKYKEILIDVDFTLSDFLDKNIVIDMQNSDFNTSKFEEFIDKKETLLIDSKFEKIDTILKCTFSNPRIEKIKNIRDFDGDVKIELDIPSGKIEGEPNANIFGHYDAKQMLVHISNRIKKFQELKRENNSEAESILENIPKGILLYGPPGTGKTKIARAFAAQVECPIIVTSGKEMTSMQYVGTGVQKIKEIFQKARDYAPSVLFIDEIDAIGTRGISENSQENNKNINALLEELDGFSKDVYKPVFVIAATNRKETIDPAIIRAGRIEEHIEIGQLDKDARENFIKYKLTNDTNYTSDINIDKFLKYTVGMSGADIEMVFRKTKYKLELKKENENNESIQIDLLMLIDVANEIRYGVKNKSRLDASFENKLTAYHESGHAIVSLVLNPSLPINQITTISRDDFAGFVSFNHEDILRYDKKFYMGMIATSYAGRLTEKMFFSNNNQESEYGVSSGASSDISNATRLIRQAILEYGMDDTLGLIAYDLETLSNETKKQIDSTIKRWEEQAKELAQNVIEKNWENIKLVAQRLEEFERIDGTWLKENIILVNDL